MFFLPENIEILDYPRIGHLETAVEPGKKGRIRSMNTSWFAEICLENFHKTLSAGESVYVVARINNTLSIIPNYYLNNRSLKNKSIVLDIQEWSKIKRQLFIKKLNREWMNSFQIEGTKPQHEILLEESFIGDNEMNLHQAQVAKHNDKYTILREEYNISKWVNISAKNNTPSESNVKANNQEIRQSNSFQKTCKKSCNTCLKEQNICSRFRESSSEETREKQFQQTA
ncbi:MAG: hypothetical protein AAGD25_16040 [Cyanobacteria bacterium P01_F01_bin.150]